MALKVGIVGMQGIGHPHAESHKADKLSNLVAICDAVKERADAGAEKYGCKAYYSLKDMLDGEPDLDVVDVATGGLENGSWHCDPAIQAMEAGKNVLVEKPLSSEVTEARAMVALAAEKNVYLGCNLNHYFTPTAARAKAIRARGWWFRRCPGLDLAVVRMKGLPAFDGLALENGENQLFGDARTDLRHFTDFSLRHGRVAGATRADALTVRQMNPMHYALASEARIARHWRIRQGTMDRDTSLAIPVLLAAALRQRGLDVDLALPWDRPHSGDYDLEELFDWIEARVAAG